MDLPRRLPGFATVNFNPHTAFDRTRGLSVRRFFIERLSLIVLSIRDSSLQRFIIKEPIIGAIPISEASVPKLSWPGSSRP